MISIQLNQTEQLTMSGGTQFSRNQKLEQQVNNSCLSFSHSAVGELFYMFLGLFHGEAEEEKSKSKNAAFCRDVE